MAKFIFTVQGEGTKSVILPVTSTQVGKVLFTGLEAKSVPFTIENTLTREVTFTTVLLEKTGTGADKVTAVVRFDNIVIAPGTSFENFLDLESVQEMDEEESFDILVSATEAPAV